MKDEEYDSAMEELKARGDKARKEMAEIKKTYAAEERGKSEEAERLVGKWTIDALAGDWKKMDYDAYRYQLGRMAGEFLVDSDDDRRDAAYKRLQAAKKRKAADYAGGVPGSQGDDGDGAVAAQED